MKKAMTNITVLVMIALPLSFVGWVLFPHIYGERNVAVAQSNINYVAEVNAINEYQDMCMSMDYSCNEDLIHNARDNASKRVVDAQASPSFFTQITNWLKL
jgi:hypothetical protein